MTITNPTFHEGDRHSSPGATTDRSVSEPTERGGQPSVPADVMVSIRVSVEGGMSEQSLQTPMPNTEKPPGQATPGLSQLLQAKAQPEPSDPPSRVP